jgi:hypothetical protein
MSRSRGIPYYVNIHTGESVWEKRAWMFWPCGVIPVPDSGCSGRVASFLFPIVDECGG